MRSYEMYAIMWSGSVTLHAGPIQGYFDILGKITLFAAALAHSQNPPTLHCLYIALIMNKAPINVALPVPINAASPPAPMIYSCSTGHDYIIYARF